MSECVNDEGGGKRTGIFSPCVCPQFESWCMLQVKILAELGLGDVEAPALYIKIGPQMAVR
jgi:hypothetical protein